MGQTKSSSSRPRFAQGRTKEWSEESPTLEKINIRRSGGRVMILKDGRLLADMPYGAAKDVARAIKKTADEAETYMNPGKLITDQATLIRTGAPFGLTNDPAFQKEAFKEAQNDPALRRYIPHVKDKVRNSRPEKFGVPTVRKVNDGRTKDSS